MISLKNRLPFKLLYIYIYIYMLQESMNLGIKIENKLRNL